VLNDRENILSALRAKPLKVYEMMKRANVVNEETYQSFCWKCETKAWWSSISTKGDGPSD